MNPELIKTIGGFLLLLVFLFFIGRETICWYFKINDRIKLSKDQNELLKRIAKSNNVDISDLEDKQEKQN